MVLILALIGWGTPLLVIHFSEQWLKDQGVPEPHIARVELNLEWLALLRDYIGATVFQLR